MPHKKRPRMIYPSIFESRKVARLSPNGFKLYIWLITQADDDGRNDWFPEQILTAPFIMAPISVDEAAALLFEVSSLVDFYFVDNELYYEIRNWKEFQKIQKDRYRPSTYPPVTDCIQVVSSLDTFRDILLPQGQGQVQRQRQGQGNGGARAKPAAPPAQSAGDEVELPLSIQKSTEIHQREFQRWVDGLGERVGDVALVKHYIASMISGVESTYEVMGGRFTEHRKGRVATRLSKLRDDAVLFAIEVFCDRFAGSKDERYICGIAKAKDRLSEKELDADVDRHRAHMKDRGLFYEVSHAKIS